jgi:hypothetical protein
MDPLMSVGTAMLFWVLWALVFLFQRGAVAVRFPSRGVVEIAGSAAVLLGVDGFLCPVDACKRWFSNSAGFARHNQSSGHGTAPVAVRGVRRRYSYSFRRKRDLILELDGLEGTTLFPLKVLSQRTGVAEGNLSKWRTNRTKIFAYARTRGVARMCRFRPQEAKYPAAELELYTRFVWRRKYQRRRTHRTWLRDNFAEILMRDHGLTHPPSEGWCSRFCMRWHI